MAAVAHFFARKRPSAPQPWSSVTLLQPVTRGVTDLRATLAASAALDYSALIQHILVCDASDSKNLALCREWIACNPNLDAHIIPVESASGLALKTVKLQVGLPHAECDVICCVDDDIILRPDALQVMLPYLYTPEAGAVFGLACYTNWSNLPSSLMSAFVNSNALLSYIPLTYLTQPFTITGHIFALRREVLIRVGGFDGLEQSVADDHELARRLRGIGLRAVQTPMVYDVTNHIPTLRTYSAQMKRWFVFPRQSLMPHMSAMEQVLTLAGSAANFIPPILAILSLVNHRSSKWRSFIISQVIFSAVYTLCELLYLKRRTPVRWRWLINLVGLVSPLQILGALLSSNEIEWRGQRLRIKPGGLSEEVRDGE